MIFLQNKLDEFLNTNNFNYKLDREPDDTYFSIKISENNNIYIDIRHDIIEITLEQKIFQIERDNLYSENEMFDLINNIILGNYKFILSRFNNKIIESKLIVNDKFKINTYRSLWFGMIKNLWSEKVSVEIQQARK